MRNRNVRRYLRSVWKLLPCRMNEKRNVICQIRDNLLQFIADAPLVNYETIVDHFGTPKQIVSTYLDEIDTEELMKSLRIKRRIFRLVSVSVVFGLLICLITAGLVYEKGARAVTGTIETSIEEIDHIINTEES